MPPKNIRIVKKKPVGLKPYEPPKKLPIMYKGNQIVVEKYKGDFKRDDIRKHVQGKSDAMRDAAFDGKVSVTLFFPGIGWRSGSFTTVGDDIILNNLDSYEDDVPEGESFPAFQIYYMKNAPRKGGCTGQRNDCLFQCLKKVLLETMPWKYPASFKKYLKIDRNDLVDIAYMPQIENKLKTFRINVSGDHTYTSTRECTRVINLKLLNGHYKLDTKDKCLQIKGIAFAEKLPMMYKNDSHNTTKRVYTAQDGEKDISFEEFRNIKDNPVSSAFILIPCDKNNSLQNEYISFVNDANMLKEETNGLINLFKTGTIVKTALNLFNHFQKSITPEPIGQTEGEWISKATYAALIFADKYEGPAYKYDVCSHYPSTMSHRLMLFPVKAGTFKRITDDDLIQRNPYGVYRCIIKKDPSVYKQFRYNKHNHYTHIDLQVANRLKLVVNMIQDDQPNVLIYDRSDLVTGSQLFGQYFEYMFKLKEREINKSKKIINVLWGGLCQRNTFTKILNEDDDKVMSIQEDRTIGHIAPVSDNQIKLEYYKNDSMYETNFARISPFLISRGRERIAKIMEPFLEGIVRCHTDGFVSTKSLDIKLGSQMGDIRYEGYCPNAIVLNNITVEGEFMT